MSIFKPTIDLESNLESRVKVLEEKVKYLEKMIGAPPEKPPEEDEEYCFIM